MESLNPSGEISSDLIDENFRSYWYNSQMEPQQSRDEILKQTFRT